MTVSASRGGTASETSVSRVVLSASDGSNVHGAFWTFSANPDRELLATSLFDEQAGKLLSSTHQIIRPAESRLGER